MTELALVDQAARPPIHNFEAEQAVLGALLLNNEVRSKMLFLKPEHFADPVHGRIYAAIVDRADRGEVVSTLTLKNVFDGDPGLQAAGGWRYLVDLSASVVVIYGAESFAENVTECWHRRQSIDALQRAIIDLHDFDVPRADALRPVTDASAAAGGARTVKTVEDFEDEVMALYRDGHERTHSTGWPSVDEFVTIRKGELSVVTGVPGSGKSEWIDAMAVNLATLFGWNFAVCSFENPTAEHVSKLAEKHSGVPFWRGPRQRMEPHELADAMQWVGRHFRFLQFPTCPTIDHVLEAAEGLGIDGLVIDPYNELEHRRPAGVTETEYVSRMLSLVRRFAQRNNCHVWMVAHPAKMYRDKDGKLPMPSLYDISGSANWVNKADVGIVVHRSEASQHMTEIHVRKVRFKSVGRIGQVLLNFDKATGRYSQVYGDV